VQRIATYIERLLLTNDCVIIPEFGGFVLHPCPATYYPGEHKFCPPYKGVVFNPALNYHNSLFWESYMQMVGLTLKEARIALQHDIEEMNHTINQGGEVYVEKIGFLRKDNEGKLFVEAIYNSSSYGLKPFGLHPFYLPPVVYGTQKQQQQPESQHILLPQHPLTPVEETIREDTKQRRIVYLPLNRTLLRVIGIAAAAIGLLLIVSTPLKEVGHSSYSASLIPAEVVTKSVTTPEIEQETIQIPALEIEPSEQPAVSEEVTPPVVTVSLPAAQTAVIAQKTYYAIIASFAAEKHARQFMQEINMPELTNMGIVNNEERARVYADKFDSQEEAESYILRLRANKKLKDTWLYVQ